VSERRPSWLTAAIIGAGAFLAGVLLVAALGGAQGTTSTTTQRVTVTAPAAGPTTPAAPEDLVRVPGVEDEPLDEARDALEGAGLEVDVQGGGLFGVVDESNWRVTGQSPAEGAQARAGDTVTVDICRRDGC
jgi:hypothetical protein